ncbi:MAG: hypothetical protein K1060chlam5_00290 [Candidatus Anoxychlamydiales bacterium]|nr:hypothetical protein [Candidatus Anoxychlamydiales bacterium]
MFFDAFNPDTEIDKKPSEVIYHVNLNKCSFFAKMIKIPKMNTAENLSYQDLPRTLEDETKINELITTLGSHGKIDLLFKHYSRLNKIGDELRYLHPFKFLGYIFSQPNLKNYMKDVFEDYFKRTNFVKDFAKTCDMYDLRNQLYKYLDNFSNEVNVPSEKLKKYVDKKDWKGLLKCLVYY